VDPAAGLERFKVRYLEGLFRAKPHLATFMGEHRWDDRLPDFSPAAIKRRETEVVEQQKFLVRLNKAALSVDRRIDAAIIADGLALELLELREIREWTWNPRLFDSFPFYDPREMIAARLSDLVHGSYAPEPVRRKNATAQLKALPRFLSEEKKALQRLSATHLQQAIKETQGRIGFFESELKAFTQSDPTAEKARQAAVAALRDFQTFLEKTPATRATRDWRIGKALYEKKFPLALQTDVSTESLSARAAEAFKKARTDLFQVARRLHQALWPKEAAPPEDADGPTQAKIIRRVRDEISKDHPKAEELVAAHARYLDRLRSFIEHRDLVGLPPRESLEVLPMPEFKRGAAGAEYLSPGMLDKTSAWRGTYYVDPIDPTWPADRVESYLRANNDYEIELTAAHEAYPGHHTQAWYARKDLNPIRATLWNGPMAEGWAVYGTELLVRSGYGLDRSDRYLFFSLKGAMVVAANTVLDIRLQRGEMTDEEALRFMIEEGFQEKAQAEKKLLRAKLDSTQLVQYFLGYDEIRQLESDVRVSLGSSFDQRKFDDALIGHGTIAVKHLRRYPLAK
jgi:uncharacterized protein (DUF885 family)